MTCNTVIFNKPRHEQDTLTYRLSVTDAPDQRFLQHESSLQRAGSTRRFRLLRVEAQTQQADIREQAVKKARLQRHVCFTTGSCMFRTRVRGNNSWRCS